MSNLQITGTIKVITEVQSGISKATKKEWKKLSFVIGTAGEYPKDVSFTVFGGEKVDNFVKYNKVGQIVDVSFEPESREYKGKYYTDLNAWKVFTNKGEDGAAAAPTTEAVADDNMPF
tara:strand:+ start:2089 stop:2442 length:354 start_codon:yes stop_codon:yes gene_type:complete